MIFDTLAVLVSISQKSIQGEKKVPKSSNQPRSQICTLFFVMSSSSYATLTSTSFCCETAEIGMYFKVARTEEVTQLWGSEKDGAILSLQTIWTCSEPSETVIPTFREMCGASSHRVHDVQSRRRRNIEVDVFCLRKRCYLKVIIVGPELGKERVVIFLSGVYYLIFKKPFFHLLS